jgi:hypothetical protein
MVARFGLLSLTLLIFVASASTRAPGGQLSGNNDRSFGIG